MNNRAASLKAGLGLVIVLLVALAVDRAYPQSTGATPTYFSTVVITGGGDRYNLLWPQDSVWRAWQGRRDSTLLAAVSADSITKALTLARKDSTAIDSAKYYYGTAGDTTSPGLFYKLGAGGTWLRADTSVSVVALGVAVDSVNKGGVCRFQRTGIYGLTRWLGRWGYGVRLFSDSTVAGEVRTGGQAAPKKMQAYGTSLDSTQIILNIVNLLAY